MKKGKRIPIAAARRIAEDYGYDQVVIMLLGLDSLHISARVAGRVMALRRMGKCSFVQLRDMSGDIQLLVKPEMLGGAAKTCGRRKWDGCVYDIRAARNCKETQLSSAGLWLKEMGDSFQVETCARRRRKGTVS